MTPAARLSAAIEIFASLEETRRPAASVLKEWGQKHRYAGSGDRSAIANLVYDALRVRASAAWIMGVQEITPADARAVILGALRRARGMDGDSIAALCAGDRFGPAPLSEQETTALAADDLSAAPDHVRGDYPQWLDASLASVFGENRVAECAAMAARAPVDLRVNLIKGEPAAALKQLDHLSVAPSTLSPWGLRIEVGADGRGPALQGEPAWARGFVEVQDEGSQLTALLSGAQPGWQVLDLCAGAGGKTLALSAMMENRGQIFATDRDGRRLMPIYDRLERAGARNVQVRAPKGERDVIGDLVGQCDLVFVDAPCTGSGTWRRNPDAKWRIRPGALAERLREQDEVLAVAERYVKPGGRLAYVTCSLLREENEERVEAFMAARHNFLPLEPAHLARQANVEALAEAGSPFGPGLRLTPLRHGTDGFYVCVMLRQG